MLDDLRALVKGATYTGTYRGKNWPESQPSQLFTGVFLGYDAERATDETQASLLIEGGKHGREIRFFDVSDLAFVSDPVQLTSDGEQV
jgi:hypothetical protein